MNKILEKNRTTFYKLKRNENEDMTIIIQERGEGRKNFEKRRKKIQ